MNDTRVLARTDKRLNNFALFRYHAREISIPSLVSHRGLSAAVYARYMIYSLVNRYPCGSEMR